MINDETRTEFFWIVLIAEDFPFSYRTYEHSSKPKRSKSCNSSSSCSDCSSILFRRCYIVVDASKENPRTLFSTTTSNNFFKNKRANVRNQTYDEFLFPLRPFSFSDQMISQRRLPVLHPAPATTRLLVEEIARNHIGVILLARVPTEIPVLLDRLDQLFKDLELYLGAHVSAQHQSDFLVVKHQPPEVVENPGLNHLLFHLGRTRDRTPH